MKLLFYQLVIKKQDLDRLILLARIRILQQSFLAILQGSEVTSKSIEMVEGRG